MKKALSEKHLLFIKECKSVFTTSEARALCERLGYSERWFQGAIRSPKFASLFVSVNYGVYRKV